MTDNVTPITGEPPELLSGPFEERRVIIDGRQMPLLTGFKEGDKYWLVADGRFCCGPFDEEQAHQAARLAGQCMAVTQGYPHLGSDNKDKPFAPTIVKMDDMSQEQI